MPGFKRGQVFKSIMPETKFTKRITPPTPLIGGERFVVVLHDSDSLHYNDRQVLVVPIVSQKEIIDKGNHILLTHIPINKTDYAFIEEDSFVCTHQVMPINRDWLCENFVQDISETELIYKIDLGIINAAGLIDLIETYVEEKANELKIQYNKTNCSKNPSTSSVRNFKRGDVFYSQMPRQDFSKGSFPPSYTLQDEHMAVVLHDSDDIQYDLGQVLIVPITTAASTVKSGNVLPTHIELLPGEFSFIKNECFICTHQIMPISRNWLDKSRKGHILPKILEIDLGIVLANDLSKSVDGLVEIRIAQLMEEALLKFQEKNA